MPALSAEQLESLKTDIKQHGVVTPVVVDQHGRILDGNNRVQIATDLGIPYPTVTQHVTDDEDALDRAVTLNCARRHLSREQQREVIRQEIQRRPADSDRAIARRVGCSPTTVGTVRTNSAKRVSNLDTREAQELSDRLLASIRHLHEGIYLAAEFALSNGINQVQIARALLDGKKTFAEADGNLASIVFDGLIDIALDPSSLSFWEPNYSGPDFLPLTDEEIVTVLDGCRGEPYEALHLLLQRGTATT